MEKHVPTGLHAIAQYKGIEAWVRDQARVLSWSGSYKVLWLAFQRAAAPSWGQKEPFKNVCRGVMSLVCCDDYSVDYRGIDSVLSSFLIPCVSKLKTLNALAWGRPSNDGTDV